MIYLLLSILSSTLIYLAFKLFDRFGVQTFPAIVVNYWTAVFIGIYLLKGTALPPLLTLPWMPLAVIEGLLFIGIFNVMALTVQKHSITVGSVASRTAMVIPAFVLMFILPNSVFSWLTVAGVILACIGVYFASQKGQSVKVQKKYLWLPIALFIGSGIIDLIIGYVKGMMIENPVQEMIFIPTIFLIAACIGTIVLLVKMFFQGLKPRWKDALAGLTLGLINYASIYFILKAMGAQLVDDAAFFPVNNMGIVAAGTLVGMLGFKEKLSPKNWFGLLLGILSIFILIFASH